MVIPPLRSVMMKECLRIVGVHYRDFASPEWHITYLKIFFDENDIVKKLHLRKKGRRINHGYGGEYLVIEVQVSNTE